MCITPPIPVTRLSEKKKLVQLTETGGEVLVRIERLEAARVRHVPHAQRLVVGGGEQVAAARVPSRAAHPVVVSHQRRQTLPRAHVPDLPPLCNVSITTKTFKLYITVF